MYFVRYNWDHKFEFGVKAKTGEGLTEKSHYSISCVNPFEEAPKSRNMKAIWIASSLAIIFLLCITGNQVDQTNFHYKLFSIVKLASSKNVE